MKSLDRLGKILYNKLQIKLPGVDKRNFTHNYYVKNHVMISDVLGKNEKIKEYIMPNLLCYS